MESPGFLVDWHREEPPATQSMSYWLLIKMSKCEMYLTPDYNRDLFGVLGSVRRHWLPRQVGHLGGVEVELLDQRLLVVRNVLPLLLWWQPGQVRLELVHNLLLVVRERRPRACRGQSWLEVGGWGKGLSWKHAGGHDWRPGWRLQLWTSTQDGTWRWWPSNTHHLACRQDLVLLSLQACQLCFILWCLRRFVLDLGYPLVVSLVH